MRIVIDMQGMQTESKFRGIGRYTTALIKALIEENTDHTIILALNGLFPETIEHVRTFFDGLLPQENIQVWESVGPVRYIETENNVRRDIAERLREAFLFSLEPDVIVITSLFEGVGDDAVTSIGVFDKVTPVVSILYDLIPLISPDEHFKYNRLLQNFYYEKLNYLKKSHALLAISESSRQEALQLLPFLTEKVFNISGACDESFSVYHLSRKEKTTLWQKYGIKRPFIMYTGGADERKNIARLIQAFAQLVPELRMQYQLVLVGKMPDNYVQKYLDIARQHGLTNDEMCMTGYVDESDLLGLYNSCSLFMFPSLHEGLGLPPLEAMACGVPVIVANATSLPEIIGNEQAMFNPTSVDEMQQKMERVLTDKIFREQLIKSGLAQSKRFSWKNSARAMLCALEQIIEPAQVKTKLTEISSICVEKTAFLHRVNKRIILFKLDHMGDMLLAIPAISKLKARYPDAKLDIVVGEWNTELAAATGFFNHIFTFNFFKRKSSESPELFEAELQHFSDSLGNYDIAIDLRRQRDTRIFLTKVRANLKVGYQSFDEHIDSQINIVLKAWLDVPYEITPLNRQHIVNQMIALIDALPENCNDYIKLPILDSYHDRDNNNIGMHLAIFPFAGNNVREWDTEKYRRLIQRLIEEKLVDSVNIYCVNNDEFERLNLDTSNSVIPHIGLNTNALITSLKRNNLCIANNSFGTHLASYLNIPVIAIYAGQETVYEWAPAFHDSYVIYINALCSPCHIASREECPNHLFCIKNITVDFVFEKIKEAIISLKAPHLHDRSLITLTDKNQSTEIVSKLTDSLVALPLKQLTHYEKLILAKSIGSNIRFETNKKQLLIDITILNHTDSKTGIQRVVKNIINTLSRNRPLTSSYTIVPVRYDIQKRVLLYAEQFSKQYFAQTLNNVNKDMPVDYYPGDIFLGLDFNNWDLDLQCSYIDKMRSRGVNVKYIVYDLLCIQLPDCFVENSEALFKKWLEMTTYSDGVICISQTVAKQYKAWLVTHKIAHQRAFTIDWFHLGDDFNQAQKIGELSKQDKTLLTQLTQRTCFLMVGTLEPRKGHSQVISAFELLWQKGIDVNLVIIGKNGWKVESLINTIERHAEFMKRLFWLQNVDDMFLNECYQQMDCLLNASKGEGFGLPLIEAAYYNLPIISRDLEIFREIAGDHVWYFSGNTAENLASSIEEWLDLFQIGTIPKSASIPRLTWKQSTQQLLRALLPPSS